MKPNIHIPEELLAGRVLLSEIINPTYDKIAIVLLGENMDPANYREGLSVIRIYLFIKEGGEYHFSNEIEAFSFEGLAPAVDFLKALPHMSALDLLLRMNAPSEIWDELRVH
ncbi:hypothetical protein AB1K89_09235 [Sporosarcina sp. 179-K 8C2 HS]|uniref:hypothetical protein n=1 Tax=Sporosarcina sp. 179-K 8C2 HS TaxID=3142387 RepID=UPI00399F4791